MALLFDAIQAGDLAAVRGLIEGDRSLLASKNERGLDAFTFAKYNRQEAVASYLLECGIEKDIFAAALAGDAGRLRELAGGDATLVNAYSRDGWTPLHLAAFFHQPEAAEALIGAGANVDALSLNAMRNTPLHAAAAGRNADVARLLAARGADVNARQEGGWTPLHAAAQNGDVELARLLITLGAATGARADNGQNPLDLALTRGCQDMVALLERNGAD